MTYIHRPKENKQDVLPDIPKSQHSFYGIRGLVAPTVGPDVFAHEENTGAGIIYRALAYRNRLFNPFNDLKIRDYQWKQINPTVFNNYKKFLTTQREAYLSEAEREYSNG